MPQKSGDDGSGAQPRNEATGDGRRADAGQRADAAGRAEGGRDPTRWIASTAVRAGLTIVGVVLLLFALVQAVGLPLLELTTDAVTSRTGRWLVVAFFAILLIGAAQRIGTAT